MKQEDRSLLKLLIEDINQIEHSETELDEELREVGINPSELVSKGLKRINELRAKQKIEFAKKKKELLASALEKLKEFKKGFDNPKEELMKIFGGDSSTQLQAFFSKVESIDEQEALETLIDAQLIDIIEKLENKGDDKGANK